MKRFALLVLACGLGGCLDSIVDNPCEDGYELSADGTACIVIADDLEPVVMPPNAERPPSPLPPALPPTPPPTLQPPANPTTIDPTSTTDTDELSPCPTC